MKNSERTSSGENASPGVIVRNTFETIFTGDTKIFADHPGLGALQKIFPQVLKAFPDFSAEFKQQLVDGNRVAMHWMFRGTHNGELFGIAPTGKAVQFQNLSISTVENGRIVQYNSEVGFVAVFMQIGILPVKPGGVMGQN